MYTDEENESKMRQVCAKWQTRWVYIWKWRSKSNAGQEWDERTEHTNEQTCLTFPAKIIIIIVPKHRNMTTATTSKYFIAQKRKKTCYYFTLFVYSGESIDLKCNIFGMRQCIVRCLAQFFSPLSLRYLPRRHRRQRHWWWQMMTEAAAVAAGRLCQRFNMQRL